MSCFMVFDYAATECLRNQGNSRRRPLVTIIFFGKYHLLCDKRRCMTSHTTTPDPDDSTLIRTIQRSGDTAAARDAVNELLGRYHRNVYLWCYMFVRDHDQALDLCQDVMVKALSGLQNFEGRSQFSSWLLAISRNHCRSALRRPEPIVDAEFDLDLFRSNDTGPAGLVEEAEAEQRLLALIKQTLEPIEQKALWMRCIERLPVDEITTMLDISAETGARSVLQRARRKLRAALGRAEDKGSERGNNGGS